MLSTFYMFYFIAWFIVYNRGCRTYKIHQVSNVCKVQILPGFMLRYTTPSTLLPSLFRSFLAPQIYSPTSYWRKRNHRNAFKAGTLLSINTSLVKFLMLSTVLVVYWLRRNSSLVYLSWYHRLIEHISYHWLTWSQCREVLEELLCPQWSPRSPLLGGRTQCCTPAEPSSRGAPRSSAPGHVQQVELE